MKLALVRSIFRLGNYQINQSEVIVNLSFAVSDRAGASSPPTFTGARSSRNPKACKWKQSVHRALARCLLNLRMVETVRKKSRDTWKCAIRRRFRSVYERAFDSRESSRIPFYYVPRRSRDNALKESLRDFLLKHQVKAYLMHSTQLVERWKERGVRA